MSFVSCTFLAQTLMKEGVAESQVPCLPALGALDAVSVGAGFMADSSGARQLVALVKNAVAWLEGSDLLWHLPQPAPADNPHPSSRGVGVGEISESGMAQASATRAGAAHATAAHQQTPSKRCQDRGLQGAGCGQKQEEEEEVYASTQLGQALVASGMSPEEALVVYQDLVAARRAGVVLLLLVALSLMLVTPSSCFRQCHAWQLPYRQSVPSAISYVLTPRLTQRGRSRVAGDG